MEHRFYVHISYIIGQQHDFIAMNFIKILALHILGADKTGLQQSRNERTCAHKRVKDMYILCGQRSVELRLENIIHRADDEIYTLYGRINNAQFSTVSGNAPLKNFSYRFLMMVCFPSKLSMPPTFMRTDL